VVGVLALGMNEYQPENQDSWREEATGICSTCAAMAADIFKDVYLREIAKIEFEPNPDSDDVLTDADWDRVCLAAERARLVAQIGLEQYQEAMRIAEHAECD
jgi:hypothetical protein